MSRTQHRLYIDEIGKASYPTSKKEVSFDNQYFGLCGVVIEAGESKRLTDMFLDLKRLIIKDIDDVSSLSLHRKDIFDKRGLFKALLDPEMEKEFNLKLLEILASINFKIIFVGLDKISHKERYTVPSHPYHYMMSIIIERYVGLLEDLGSTGDVMAESINKKEDEILQGVYENFLIYGSDYCRPNRIKDRVTSSRIKFKEKKDNVSGLEVSDILAIPVLFQILHEKGLKKFNNDSFNKKIVDIISKKYYRYGKKLIT